ncbi:DNA damage-binding protein 2 isoform X1 [Neofelis nebulosa]|uniref:DNA damage-binding protein 2 isoform X1 n=1 Tax=Neofelis nebulosa TaxID=61452 RepID=UPI00272A0727|nr:DNA damage-binding protein 2 isoform X1 [Neofelis nebulosa]XP_058544900.1 DNA damage-binding protein 2 isoform X1 [Neofelis nebulosa]
MAPRKRPETQKTPEVVVRPKSRRSRSPRELEPEAKKLCVKGPGSSRRFDSGCLWAGLASLQVPPSYTSVVRALHHHKLGKAAWPSLQQGLQQSFVHSLASYRIFQKAAPFDRRATSLAWHPAHPSTLAVGSKGGDIMLWNFGIKDKPTFIKGIGAGGSVTGLKFNPLDTNQFFTSSMEGTTRLQDFKGNTLRVFTSSDTCNIWFCSLDVSARSRMVVTGDNVGHVILLNMDGRELWNLRMHKKKVTHVALNPCCDWLLATASVDQTVKIWDLRQVKGKSSCLHSLLHSHPVNAACFSPDGAQLLTTDQKSELRVYSASQWDCPPSLIPHPHRHFQHLTPIKPSLSPCCSALKLQCLLTSALLMTSPVSAPKATWHPRYNLIVVGRYPDPNFKSCTPHELRTIDVFDGSSGKMMYQLYDPESSGIISLNEFNPMGDTLASVMGYHILIWSQEAGMRK